eukprot:4030420-Alexandrium_andersonii.AAC.1
MSASLVGSEMCIRDRASSTKPTSRRTSPSGWSSSTPRVPPRRSSSVGPVSYTHLTLPTICSV